jgi:hypothetical protein
MPASRRSKRPKRDTRVRDTLGDQLPFELWREELAHPHESRRRAARNAMASLTHLVELRAKEARVALDVAWRDVFDLERLQADLDSSDAERCEAAERALCALAIMVVRREAMDANDETSSRRKLRLFELALHARRSANDIACAIGEPFDLVMN